MFLKATIGVLTITASLGVAFLSSARSEQDVSPARNAKDAKKDTADEKTVRALIAELSADSFDKREAAQKSLSAIGAPALNILGTQPAVQRKTPTPVQTQASATTDQPGQIRASKDGA